MLDHRNMHEELISALARLASLEYQRRYVIGGTADAYVLPEELLEDVDGLVLRARRAENARQFTSFQLSCLQALADTMGARSGEALEFLSPEDAAEKIVHSAVWSELREKASAALVGFGRDINATSVEQIDEGQIASAP